MFIMGLDKDKVHDFLFNECVYGDKCDNIFVSILIAKDIYDMAIDRSFRCKKYVGDSYNYYGVPAIEVKPRTLEKVCWYINSDMLKHLKFLKRIGLIEFIKDVDFDSHDMNDTFVMCVTNKFVESFIYDKLEEYYE